MIESSLRPTFQKIFIKPVMHLGAHYFSANCITILALITGFIAACFLSVNFNYFALLFLVLSGYLDILDGSIARIQNKSTHFGTVLDILRATMDTDLAGGCIGEMVGMF